VDFVEFHSLPEKQLAITVGRDITERKKAEAALKVSEKKANALIKYAPTGIYEIDYRFPKFKTVNDAMCKILGVTREELLATNPLDLLDDESKVRFKERIMKLLAGQEIDENVEFKVKAKDGRIIYAVLNVMFTYKEGKPDGAVVIAHDVTGRKQTEEKLRESEQRWATTLASIGDAVIATDLSGKVTFMNVEAEKLTGWKLNDASMKPVKEIFNIVNEQTRFEVEDPVSKVLEKGIVVGLANHTVLIRKDKTEVAIDDSGAPILDKDGKTTGIVLIFRDITERKKTEAQAQYAAKKLKDAERLAAIGATAGMVGHDIRNPLQAITGDLYLAKTELVDVPDSLEKTNVLENLKEIEQNIDYINKIVADLQDFARPLKPHFEEVDLKQIITELLAKNEPPEDVKVTVEVEDSALKVQADSSYINRVLYNLVTNAVQAMPKGGKLTVHAYRKADDAVITVKDTGVGIPDQVKDKLFTPMFTTKSKGQGFGLAVIKRMTEVLGGEVTFTSQEGKGTQFTVRFPQTLKKKTNF
jgi:PAS domain S-box-containing protein